MQNSVSDDHAVSWAWYDLAILDRADASEPKVFEKRSLVWVTNELPFTARGKDQSQEHTFNRDHEIFKYLKVTAARTLGDC